MAAERLFGIRALGMRRFVQWALAVIVLCAALLESPLGQRLEAEFGLRWLYQIRGPLPSPPDTVLVTMDDAAANTLGETIGVEDWPRTLHACLIERLAAMHAAVIVMDVNFESAVRNDPPPDAYSAPVRKSCTLRNGSAGTEQLGAVIAQAGNVLLASYLGQRNDAGVQMVWERMPGPERLSAAGTTRNTGHHARFVPSFLLFACRGTRHWRRLGRFLLEVCPSR